MNDKDIRPILMDALEEEIDSSQVNLWPVVRARVVARDNNWAQRGAKMKTRRLHRIPRFALVATVVVVMLAATLLTPQGQALSQSILQFFTQVEETIVPLPHSQTASGVPGPSVPTAEPPAPLISIAEAEAQAGYGVAELPFVPDGLDYLGARLYAEVVSVEYQTQGYDGHLIIKQSQQGFYQSDWDRAPANTIVPVKIGELDGEFVRGTFVVYAGENVSTWNPDAPILRLRWVQDGVFFEMTKSGNAEVIAYLDQAGLIKLAESLAIKP